MFRFIIFRYFLRPILRFVFGIQYRGSFNLRPGQSFILIANHNSHFDALCLLAALPRWALNSVRTVGAADYFGQQPLIRRLLTSGMRMLLIHRERQPGRPAALDRMSEVLDGGGSLILFPEGTRGAPGVMGPFRSGIGVLLRRYPQVVCLPTYLTGLGRVLPKASRWPLPLVTQVRFGDPFRPEVTEVQCITQQVKDRVRALGNLPSFTHGQFHQTPAA